MIVSFFTGLTWINVLFRTLPIQHDHIFKQRERVTKARWRCTLVECVERVDEQLASRQRIGSVCCWAQHRRALVLGPLFVALPPTSALGQCPFTATCLLRVVTRSTCFPSCTSIAACLSLMCCCELWPWESGEDTRCSLSAGSASRGSRTHALSCGTSTASSLCLCAPAPPAHSGPPPGPPGSALSGPRASPWSPSSRLLVSPSHLGPGCSSLFSGSSCNVPRVVRNVNTMFSF